MMERDSCTLTDAGGEGWIGGGGRTVVVVGEGGECKCCELLGKGGARCEMVLEGEGESC